MGGEAIAFPGGRVGRADLDLDLSLGDDGPIGRVAASVQQLSVAGRTLPRARVEVHRARPDEAKVVAGATLGATRAETVATVSMPDGFGGDFGVTLHRLEALHRGLGIRATPGAQLSIGRDGTYEVSGLSLRRRRGRGWGPPELRAAAKYTGDETLKAHLHLSGVDVASWVKTVRGLFPGTIPPLPIGGVLTADLHTAGPLVAPTLRADLSLSRGRFGDIRALTLTADARARDGHARGTLDARWRGARITGKVSAPAFVALNAAPRLGQGGLDASAQFEGVALERLSDLVPGLAGVSGRASGGIKLSGRTSRPRSETMVAIDGLDVPALRPLDVTLRATTGIRPTAEIEGRAGPARLSLKSDDPVAALLAGMPLRRVLEGPISGTATLSPTRLDALLESERVGERGAIVAECDLNFAGTLSRLSVTGTARARDLGLLRDLPSDVALTLGADGDRPTADAVVTIGNERVATAKAILPRPLSALDPPQLDALLASPALRVDASSELELAALERLVPGIYDRVRPLVGDAVVTTRVFTRGATGGPLMEVRANMVGTADAPIARIDVTAQANGESSEIGLRIDQPEIMGAIEVKMATTVGTRAALEDALPERDALPVKGSVKANRLDMSVLAALLPAVQTSRGTLEVSATLGGRIGEPRLAGDIRAHFDELILPPLGWVQNDLDIVLEVQPDRVVLPKTTLKRGEGRLSVGLVAEVARYSLPGIGLDGQVDIRSFPVLERDDLSATLSGDITVGGSAAAPEISGRIIAEDVLVKPRTGSRPLTPIGPPPDVVYVDEAGRRAQREAAEAAAGKGPARLVRPKMNLTLEVPRRALRVKNDLLDVWAEGSLRVGYGGDGLTVNGLVEIDEGTVSLYGREFVLQEESQLVFDGPASDPALAIEAQFSLEDVTLPSSADTVDDPHILLAVAGRASKPEITLTSSPALSQTDILSLITIGVAVGGETSPDATSTGVPSVLLQALGSQAARMLQDRLPLDIVQLSTGSSGSLSDARLRLGKRFLRNLTVSYYGNYAADGEEENQNEVGLQYDITPRWQLDSRFGDAGAGTVDVIYHWRW